MSVQTKLDSFQKAILRGMRMQQGDALRVFHFPENRVTIGVKYTPGHNAARVFVSIASLDETKYRKKVGEFFVREGFDDYSNGVGTAGVPAYVPKQLRNDSCVHHAIAHDILDAVGVPFTEV